MAAASTEADKYEVLEKIGESVFHVPVLLTNKQLQVMGPLE